MKSTGFTVFRKSLSFFAKSLVFQQNIVKSMKREWFHMSSVRVGQFVKKKKTFLNKRCEMF